MPLTVNFHKIRKDNAQKGQNVAKARKKIADAKIFLKSLINVQYLPYTQQPDIGGATDVQTVHNSIVYSILW